MRLQLDTTIPAAAAAVAAALADPGFVTAKVEASGALEHTVDVTSDPNGGFTVTTRRTLPTDRLPGQARALIGTKLEVRTVEVWQAAESDGGRNGTVVVEVTGAPVRLSGTVHLAAVSETESRLSHDADLKASVPLFGAMVEEAAGGALRTTIAAESAALTAWITDHGTNAGQ